MKFKFEGRLRVLSIALLLVILLAACAPAVQLADADIVGKTAMSLIFDGTVKTVESTWWITGWVLGISLGLALGAAVFRMAGDSAGYLVAPVVFAVVLGLSLLVFHLAGASAARNTATHAIQVGADTAKTRKANQFVEKLHIPATKAILEPRKCHESDGGTGCKYYWTYDYNYHEVCTNRTVDDGDGKSHTVTECHTEHDTRYVPYFTEEWRTYAYFSMPDEYLKDKVGENAGTNLEKSEIANMPTRLYTDWQAPEDYNSYLWGPSNRDQGRGYQLGPFDYVIPGEFKAIKAALDSGRPYVITVWHHYVNWVFITSDTNNLMTTSSLVQKYQAAGLLPTVNMIYSRWGTANEALKQDYDFVQFTGGLQPVDPQGWQDSAAMYSLNVGPTLQGSMVIWGVPAQSVDDPDSLIQAGKAYLSDKPTFNFFMAPKNLILILFGVDQNNNIAFCRMETGMPSGNVEIENSFRNCPVGLPFTPQTIFGTMNPTATPDANGFYTSTMEVPADGMLAALFAPEPQGFKRVKMASMDWLKTDIKLEASDINWVIDTETKGARTASMVVSLIAIVLSLGLGFYALSD